MTKKLFIVFLAAVLLLFGLSATCVYVTACAEETVQETPAEPQEPATEEEPGQPDETPQEGEGGGIQALIEGFIAQLKDKYGDQWQQYYDAIIAEWGTVEQYLLSLVPEDAPDVVKDGWTSFVDWTRENWVVLAAIGATILLLSCSERRSSTQSKSSSCPCSDRPTSSIRSCSRRITPFSPCWGIIPSLRNSALP